MAKDAKDSASSAPTKAGFIRQFPTDTPADDIVALGAEAGIELTKKMIWTVQSEMRHPTKKKGAAKTAKKSAAKKSAKKPAKKTAKKSATKKATKANKTTPTTSKAAEQRLKALILQVGLARAEAVYDQLRHQLDALLD